MFHNMEPLKLKQRVLHKHLESLSSKQNQKIDETSKDKGKSGNPIQIFAGIWSNYE